MAKHTTPAPPTLDPVPLSPNLEAWFKGGNAGVIKETLMSTVFRKAESLLKEQARPTRAMLRDAETNSLNNAWYAGYCDAFRDLRRLGHAPEKSLTSFDSEAWKHIT